MEPASSRIDARQLTDWLVGENSPHGTVDVQMCSDEVILVRTMVVRPTTPRPRTSTSFPAPTVQLLTQGRLPIAADMGYGRFEGVATPGSFIVTPAGQDCTFRVGADFELLGLSMPATLLEDLLRPAFDGELPDLTPLHRRLLHSARVAHMLETLWFSASARELGSRLRLHSELLKLFDLLLTDGRETTPARGRRGGLAPLQFARACETMDHNLSRGVSLQVLAQEVGLSPAHFGRAFKASSGASPFTWLLRRRVELAQSLLKDPDRRLRDIALDVGFAGQSQFTTAFTRVVGIPPGAWRRRHVVVRTPS